MHWLRPKEQGSRRDAHKVRSFICIDRRFSSPALPACGANTWRNRSTTARRPEDREFHESRWWSDLHTSQAPPRRRPLLRQYAGKSSVLHENGCKHGQKGYRDPHEQRRELIGPVPRATGSPTRRSSPRQRWFSRRLYEPDKIINKKYRHRACQHYQGAKSNQKPNAMKNATCHALSLQKDNATGLEPSSVKLVLSTPRLVLDVKYVSKKQHTDFCRAIRNIRASWCFGPIGRAIQPAVERPSSCVSAAYGTHDVTLRCNSI